MLSSVTSLDFRASLCVALLCVLNLGVRVDGFCTSGIQPTLPKEVTSEFQLIRWPKNEIQKCIRCKKRHRYCIEGKFGQAVLVQKTTSMCGKFFSAFSIPRRLGNYIGVCEYVPDGKYVIKTAQESGDIVTNKDNLENECRMSRLIQAKPHKNLVQVMRVGKRNNYILLERCEPLGKLDDGEIVRVLKSALRGLEHMHEVLGIAHLDLHRSQLAKTRNGSKWVYKLLDFGASSDDSSDIGQDINNDDSGIPNLIKELTEVTQGMSWRTRQKLDDLESLCNDDEVSSVSDILAEW